ncbi:D-alanyl-D-alanine carboxypeptidase family protein [Longirhabdus pacifica]|uniref:D-alanyl-D-alanine carboxypeptidase family protein n=1 Tax=Longirhabdus pacifica TaxID=2305227 RepID=UPI001008B6CF
MMLLVPSSWIQAEGIHIHAESAVLIDVTSGRVLYERNADKRMRIASLTKVMTAIVAIEHGDLSDKVTVSRNAEGVEGSSIYLQTGDEMSLEHLLYGLMLRSGNDAAVAIAEHVGGSLDGFVYLMNEKATELGMENSTFKNPHGLDADGHLSTSKDVAKLTAYALKNEAFQNIVKTKSVRVPDPEEDWDMIWRNKNKMLSRYEGSDGVKTGYTVSARRCLISSATRNNQQLAVVTLNDPNDWVDHANLLNYGFETYPLRSLVEEDSNPIENQYIPSQSFYYPLTESELSQVKYDIDLEDKASLSYRLGKRGKINFYLKGHHIGNVPLNIIQQDKEQMKPASASLSVDENSDSGIGKWMKTLQVVLTGSR